MFVQQGLQEAVSKSRKQIKERKNRTKKLRGTKKAGGKHLQSGLDAKQRVGEGEAGERPLGGCGFPN